MEKYVPALAYAPLTRFYDVAVGMTTRESTFKKALVLRAGIRPGDQVLDVACGTGTLALMMKASAPGAIITGIDGDPAILAIARDKTLKAGSDIHYDEGMSYQLPYADEQFDIVTSSLFFHHLGDDMKLRTSREIFRILKPEGMLHVADWGRPTSRLMRLAFFGIQLLDGFENTDSNRKGALPTIFREAGFERSALDSTFSTMFGTMALYSARKKPDNLPRSDGPTMSSSSQVQG